MLPPQLRQSIHPSRLPALTALALKATTPAVLQSRAFWSWRRDWASQLDPVYHRFCRIRTLKTRAKLLQNLRRRGKFNWDLDSKPFFTPRHVRFASHWDGSGRRKGWILDGEDGRKTKDEKTTNGSPSEEDGFELSAREREWTEKMEAWRKRVEKDPYEAVFGKRFEPFWSPLVPSWMREEMGLQGWPKRFKDTPKDSSNASPGTVATKTVTNETGDNKSRELELSKKVESTQTKTNSPKTASYSYASSTSWDSRTNTTRKVEWDSVSGQTRKYEYDPISNRMIQVEAPKAAATESKGIASASQPTRGKEGSADINVPTPRSILKSSDSAAANIPTKQSSELRKSIPIPPPSLLPFPTTSLGFSKRTVTSIGPLRTTAIASDAPRPSALATLPEKPSKVDKDVDSLTADQIRASIGRTKEPSGTAAKLAHETSPMNEIQKERNSAPGRMHVSAATTSQWDQAEMGVILDKELESLQKKKDKLIKDERGLFHIERQKRELQKLDERINEVTARVDKLNFAAGATVSKQPSDPSKGSSAKTTGLRTSLDRMQNKELPNAIDPDDSAAHESTEAIAALNGVPKNWAQQAELLQADRVRRTASTRPYPMSIPVKRWADDMQARKAAYEADKAKQAPESEQSQEAARKRETLEKANKMLEEEVAEQKMKMQAYETRYAHKIRSLRQELGIAYKQSTVHAEKHLERVKYLEQELDKALKAAEPKNFAKAMEKGLEKRRQDNMILLEMEKAAQKVSDDALIARVREIYEKKYGIIDAGHRQLPPTNKAQEQPSMPLKREKQVVEVESDVDLGEALAKYERDATPYSSTNLGLENEVATKEREFYEGQTSPPKSRLDKPSVITPAGKESGTQAKVNSADASLTASVQWEEPPVYMVLAYDSGNDMMSTATTTANFTGAETPISVPQALSQLYQPARFVPYFANLQKDGYQVIFGTKDLLVFKKVKSASAVTAAPADAEFNIETPSLEDHGVFGREKSNWSDASSINPVDGTAKQTLAAPSTGNFASPTGFVNHEPIMPVEAGSETVNLQDREVTQNDEDLDIEWRHYPRVRRMEQHFTGSRRRWNSGTNRRPGRRFEDKGSSARRRHRRSTWRWVLGVGFGTAAVMYGVGAAAEAARESKEVDWAKKAEEERKRWRGL